MSPIRQFLLHRALLNGLLNVGLSFTISYFSLAQYPVLHLFEGDQNLAKVFLPMGFLLPFFISLDSMNRFWKLLDQDKLPYEVRPQYPYKRNTPIIACLSGLLVGLLSSGVLGLLALLLPTTFFVERTYAIGVQVLLAAVFAVFFTYQPILYLKDEALLPKISR